MVVDTRCGMAQGTNEIGKQIYEIVPMSGAFGPGLPNLEKVVDDKENLEIYITKSDNIFRKISIRNVIFFRRFEERFMLSSIDEMDKSGVLGNFIILIKNSHLIDFLNDESYSTCEGLNIRHIRFLFRQDIVDILTIGDPGIST